MLNSLHPPTAERMEWLKSLKPGDQVFTNYWDGCPLFTPKAATVIKIEFNDSLAESGVSVELEGWNNPFAILDSYWIKPIPKM